MSKPIFFSVCGPSEAVARDVQRKFSSDRIYLYSDNGKQGADFPAEIERRIAECQRVVIFWSAKYIAEDHPWTRRELALVGKRKLHCDPTPDMAQISKTQQALLTPTPKALKKALTQSAARARRMADAFGLKVPGVVRKGDAEPRRA